ncbi:MAG: 50S ribosomal protein L32e [Desulfurococcales archaeon]|nr:50S ribosomal protein L32e [Desulfurococcales archaeon]MEB3759014.1 50S ribosomal protein L32e [Desulfurococcales archaeon]MEB3772972.1 50S ribosomal protein L32e [Desulfurococcales archaeon]MEB3786480.1 50S ribosomal protein L32e [Desulfurococcales archaeon]MEB3786501.1 50S ribosomal protein L32e [Desulfurococcales archaeon]
MSSESISSKRNRIYRFRRRKIKFVRYLSWRFWKLGRKESWRKPKGIDNKMRLQLKGYPPIVKVGYGSPRDIRGLHPSGLKPVWVRTLSDLDNVDPETEIVYISSSVGLRLKNKIIEAARERGIRVANGGML